MFHTENWDSRIKHKGSKAHLQWYVSFIEDVEALNDHGYKMNLEYYSVNEFLLTL